MVSKESNLKFIRAVIHWLSAFPTSTISYNEPLDHLCRPQLIISILRLIIDDSFNIDLDFQNYQDLNKELFVDVDEVEEYESIFESVKQYFKDKLWSRKKLFKYLDMLKLEDLHLGDYFALTVLCFIFAEIGFHSFKSGIAISSISMLEDDDQLELNQFLHDEQDLSGRNLILSQRVNFMELENSTLKKKLHSNELEILKLKKHLDSHDENVYVQVVNDQKLEISQLKEELKKWKLSVKELQRQLDQLTEDLSLIGALQSMTMSPRPLKVKNDNVMDKELALKKWELDIMSDWICLMSVERRR